MLFGIVAFLFMLILLMGVLPIQQAQALSLALAATRPGLLQAYLKASSGETGVSGDTLVVGAQAEPSNATGVNDNQSDNSSPNAGATLSTAGHSNISLTGTTQLRLRFVIDDNNDLGADFMKFFSGDFATVVSRPTLVIEYFVP